MDNFVAVFPSNVQPHIFPDNTASHFYTNFENPIQLHGQWEVAVKDISYVHNIQTIRDETITVGEVDNPQLTFPYLEHANMLITYDMKEHQYEWILETRRNLYEWLHLVEKKGGNTKETERLQNEDHIFALLNILNRIGKNLWLWTYLNNKICFRYTCNLKDVSYAFYLSEELASVLNMQHQMLVPHPGIKVLPSTKAYMYETRQNTLSCFSQTVRHDTKWEADKFKVTLLPLHRMKKVVLQIPNGDTDVLIEYVMSKVQKYGLSVRYTRAKDNSQLTWVYKHRFDDEKNPVAFIQFSETMSEQLDCHHTVVMNPIKFVGKVFDPQFIDTAIITVWLKEVTPPPYKLESWSPVNTIKLPSKYYSTPYEFLRVLNNHQDYAFSFNKGEERFQLNVINRCVVRISDRLKTILGFDKNIFFNETVKASRAPLLDKNIHHFYLYSNIVAPTHVGGAEVPMLRYIPISNVEYGQTVFVEWNNLTYLPISVSELRQVELGLYDDTGERVNFVDGRTVVTLHFKKV